MILCEIKDHLRAVGRAPLPALCDRFGVDPDALRGMLDVWVGKEKLRRIETGDACGGCTACDRRSLEVYEWTGD